DIGGLMRCFLPTALSIALLALAGAAQAATPQAAISSDASAGAAVAPAAPTQARPLDLRPPNFFSPRWQRRLQGPTIDHSLDYMPMEAVVVTPAAEPPSNLQVSPAGLGSLWWAMLNPSQAWRILLPVREGDEFNIHQAIALAYNDPNSD